MAKYAANTTVDSTSSRAEIERTLIRYGASSFGYLSESQRAAIHFVIGGRRIRLVVALPEQTAREFTHTPGRGLERTEKSAYEAWEQACRQKWRALALWVKAQLEAIESGIITFEDAWLPHTVLPSGRTVAEEIEPQIERALGNVAQLQIGM